ncbi:MAG: MerR family transcriptional regulator [Spirochaetaceae bacterium]|nr:MerR family transcriptional regulator [Spirochaetaceae bacterium]
MSYSVKELADLAGVSVRTLHHYDAIGLLRAQARTAAGYRYYGEPELLRLQQILFYRELDLSLGEIASLLDRPGFDELAALENHKRLLAARAERIFRLIDTVDRTIGRLKGETMLSDKELYEGFSHEEIDSMKTEAKARWGHTAAYAESQKRVARMGKEEWAAVKKELAKIDEDAALCMRKAEAPDSAATQAVMARKYASLRHFYEPSPEMFAGLGAGYVEDPRFRAHYESTAPGLAEYLRDAMAAYARSAGAGFVDRGPSRP